MYAICHEVDVLGTATGYTPVTTGRVLAVVYIKHATNGYDAGVDFSVTTETTAQTVWGEDNVNASKTVYPRRATQDTAGVDAVYILAGQTVKEPIVVANERVAIAVSSGGAAKTGKFYVIVG